MSYRRQVSGFFLVAALLTGVVGPLMAQTPQKTLFGTRDFEMDWQLAPAGKVLRVRFSAATKRLRIEALDGSEQVMLRDLVKGDIVILIAQGQKGAYAQTSPPLAPFAPQEVGGTREIAGNPCREFSVQGQKLCVTDDGIPVGVDFGTGSLTAQSLVRQAQHPALFLVPKDLVLKPVPGSGANTLPKLPF
ncbi:MAG: hypothetical protein FD175_910 [Beijerinckiaceae bacterium]|nr:MAG: hypothetical protein FD175_910 [Beijerinckiaceae bacterium]